MTIEYAEGDRLLTLTEAADYLGISKTTLFEMLDRNEFLVVRVTPRNVRIPSSSIAAWVKDRLEKWNPE